MKKYFSTFILLFFVATVMAQSDSSWRFKRKNIINFEVLGSAVLYSLNYERLFVQSKYFKSYVSTGISYAPYRFYNNQSDVQFLFNYNQLISFSKNNHFDVGIGLKLLKNYNPNEIVTQPIFHAGIRFQKPTGKFMLKLLLAGTIERMVLTIIPSKTLYSPNFYPCVGFGYTF
jgi:hypothetical protein